MLKLAVTDAFAFIATLQLPVPLQEPLHPAKVEPAAAVAASETDAPCVKFAEHVEPQLMPEGLLVTVPLPVPDLLTLSVRGVDAADRYWESPALYATSKRP